MTYLAQVAFGMAIALAGPLTAGSHKPVAPDYYVDTALAIALAEQYAWHCPIVEVDIDAVTKIYGGVLARLADLGVPQVAPHDHMLLPPQAETDKVIRDMLARHQASSNPEASFCAGARAERDVNSLVGQMLKGAGS